MKKVFSVVLTSFLVSSFGWSQYEIYHESSCNAVNAGSVDISGGVHVENNNAVGTDVTVHLYIKNLTGSTKTLAIKRVRLNVPIEWEDQNCWGPCYDPDFEGLCYGNQTANSWTSPTVTVMNDSTAELKPIISLYTTEGGGLYRYYFMDGSTTVDSIDVHINKTASINDLESVQVGMTAYPNPASSMITVNTIGISGDYNVRITDVLGKAVYADEAGAIKKIDVSNFKNGVYLITIAEKGEVIQTRRVVVKH
jgi:Secretion system C-terminal sorting domain